MSDCFSLTLVTAFRLWCFYVCPTLPTPSHFSLAAVPLNPLVGQLLPQFFFFINCRKLRTVPPPAFGSYVTYHMNFLASPKENVIICSIKKKYKKKIGVLEIMSHFSPLSPIKLYTGELNSIFAWAEKGLKENSMTGMQTSIIYRLLVLV